MSFTRRASSALSAQISSALLRSALTSSFSRFQLHHGQNAVLRAASKQQCHKQFSTLQAWRQASAAAATSTSRGDEEAGEATPKIPLASELQTFAQLSEQKLVCDTVVKTITDQMKLTNMTEVQSQTIRECLAGKDVLAQARTGTGKTMAFLVPLLQNIISKDASLEKYSRQRKRNNAEDIRAIIISPTRELAEQIAQEARKLARNTNVVIQAGVGGTQKRHGLQIMQREGCHVLVGTPGRLHDLLSDPYSNVRAPRLSALVLDEADRLLDQGFLPQLEEIKKQLPPENERQTLLFSATVPREVMRLVRSTLKPGFTSVRTIGDEEDPTHKRVPQKMVRVRGLENAQPALIELIQKLHAQATPEFPFKAIVFYNTTADVALAAGIMQGLSWRRRRPQSTLTNSVIPADCQILETHGRLTQAQRTMAANDFRRAKSAVLLSSDVTARGMDFPGVSHVIQMGVPQNRDSYVHRLGRTARANKNGEGWLFVNELERGDLRSRLHGLPIMKDTSLELAVADLVAAAETTTDAGPDGSTVTEGQTNTPTRNDGLSENARQILEQLRQSTESLDRNLLKDSFMSKFGSLASASDRYGLVAALNRLATIGWGFSAPPPISRSLASKLGVLGVPGLNVGSSGGDRGRFDGDDDEDDFSGGRDSSRYSSGGRDGGRDSGRRDGGSFGNRRSGRGGGGSYGGRDGGRDSRGAFGPRRDGFSGGYSGGRSSGGNGTFSRARGGAGGSGGRDGDSDRNRWQGRGRQSR